MSMNINENDLSKELFVLVSHISGMAHLVSLHPFEVRRALLDDVLLHGDWWVEYRLGNWHIIVIEMGGETELHDPNEIELLVSDYLKMTVGVYETTENGLKIHFSDNMG